MGHASRVRQGRIVLLRLQLLAHRVLQVHIALQSDQLLRVTVLAVRQVLIVLQWELQQQPLVNRALRVRTVPS